MDVVLIMYMFLSNVSDTTKVWYRDDPLTKKLWFEVNTEIVSLKAYSKSSQMGKRTHLYITHYSIIY
jgi:hypothetical protein